MTYRNIELAASLKRCALASLGALASGVALAASVVPSNFSTSVGDTLLCLNQLDEIYFRQYFTAAFGQPYKHEGGAYWFKADVNLWGVPMTDVLVSDESGPMTFLAAVADVAPDKLDEAVINAMGIHHNKLGSPTYAIRQSNPGSQIVYFNKKSKIFCAKSRYLLPN